MKYLQLNYLDFRLHISSLYTSSNTFHVFTQWTNYLILKSIYCIHNLKNNIRKSHFTFKLKKPYIFKEIELYTTPKIHWHSYFKEFFQKIINRQEGIMQLINIPVFFYLTFINIFRSLTSKTIYLFKIILLLILPTIFYYLNPKIINQSSKLNLQYILTKNINYFLLNHGNALNLHNIYNNYVSIYNIHKNIEYQNISKNLLINFDNIPSIPHGFIFNEHNQSNILHLLKPKFCFEIAKANYTTQNINNLYSKNLISNTKNEHLNKFNIIFLDDFYTLFKNKTKRYKNIIKNYKKIFSYQLQYSDQKRIIDIWHLYHLNKSLRNEISFCLQKELNVSKTSVHNIVQIKRKESYNYIYNFFLEKNINIKNNKNNILFLHKNHNFSYINNFYFLFCKYQSLQSLKYDNNESHYELGSCTYTNSEKEIYLINLKNIIFKTFLNKLKTKSNISSTQKIINNHLLKIQLDAVKEHNNPRQPLKTFAKYTLNSVLQSKNQIWKKQLVNHIKNLNTYYSKPFFHIRSTGSDINSKDTNRNIFQVIQFYYNYSHSSINIPLINMVDKIYQNSLYINKAQNQFNKFNIQKNLQKNNIYININNSIKLNNKTKYINLYLPNLLLLNDQSKTYQNKKSFFSSILEDNKYKDQVFTIKEFMERIHFMPKMHSLYNGKKNNIFYIDTQYKTIYDNVLQQNFIKFRDKTISNKFLLSIGGIKNSRFIINNILPEKLHHVDKEKYKQHIYLIKLLYENKHISNLYNDYDVIKHSNSKTSILVNKLFEKVMSNLHVTTLNNRQKIHTLNILSHKLNQNILWIPSSLNYFDFNYQQENSINTKYTQLTLTKLLEESNSIPRKKTNLTHQYLYEQLNILKQYNAWIFTPQWWLYMQRIIDEMRIPVLQDIYDIVKYSIHSQIDRLVVLKTIQNNAFPWIFSKSIFEKNFSYFKDFLVEELDKDNKREIPIWISLNILQHLKTNQWGIISWLVIISIIYYHWLPTLLGTGYLYLWSQFEKIRNFQNPSWNTSLIILAYNANIYPSRKTSLETYSSRGWTIWIRNKIYSKFFENKVIKKSFLNINSLDISRKQKNLTVQSLVTTTSLHARYQSSNLGIQQIHKSLIQSFYNSDNQISLFEKWAKNYYSYNNFIQEKKMGSYFFKWMTTIFFNMKIANHDLVLEKNVSLQKSTKIPINVSDNFFFTKRLLLIGSIDAGKAYFIKNFAVDTNLPLIHISLRELRHATPNYKFNNITKQITERVKKLVLMLNLTKLLTPSILWISDLHEFNTQDIGWNKKTDAALLVNILLKNINNKYLHKEKHNIIIIGSTDNPRLLDPKFIAPDRLECIINLRRFSLYQREKILKNLLINRGMYLSQKRALAELGINTTGYSFRDLVGIINETCLINITKNRNFVDLNTIKLAIYRQMAKVSSNNILLEQESLRYKLGKAIVQTTLVYPKPILPLSLRHDLWKTRFYYLSHAYLEYSPKKSTVTEFTMLSHILSCLSGSAAKDAWILTIGKLHQETLALNNQIKDDFYLASNLCQSLLLEFPTPHIYHAKVLDRNNSIHIPIQQYEFQLFKTKTLFNQINSFNNYINWSPRIQRLSFSWRMIFKGIQRKLSQNLTISSIPVNLGQISNNFVIGNLIEHTPYKRNLNKTQQEHTQKVETSFNKMILQHTLESMGFPFASQYVMDHESLQSSILLIGRRPTWAPSTLTPPYHINLVDRELLIGRDMLTKIYFTYGIQIERDKMNPRRIKKQVLWSNNILQPTEIKEISINNDRKQNLMEIQNFNEFRIIAKTNSQLQQPQLHIPVYLYKNWINIGPTEHLYRISNLDNRNKSLNENPFLKEALIYTILLESYHYLLKFFINNNILIEKIEYKLTIEKKLFRAYIENSLLNINPKKF
uniref:Cell division protein n=1 Tax=Roya obtusa TaxID=104537 RepID=A0A191T6A0_9VIRI|nr:cell division protein [Roya obtusa]ANI25923.1 cell division protein [Roya obtusa]